MFFEGTLWWPPCFKVTGSTLNISVDYLVNLLYFNIRYNLDPCNAIKSLKGCQNLPIIGFLCSCRYAANIEKIDYEAEKVLIHYRQWSHRYDEWFDWTSPCLRAVERVQLRRQGLQDDCVIPVRWQYKTFSTVPYSTPKQSVFPVRNSWYTAVDFKGFVLKTRTANCFEDSSLPDPIVYLSHFSINSFSFK